VAEDAGMPPCFWRARSAGAEKTKHTQRRRGEVRSDDRAANSNCRALAQPAGWVQRSGGPLARRYALLGRVHVALWPPTRVPSIAAAGERFNRGRRANTTTAAAAEPPARV
jgi:hypothetical protein